MITHFRITKRATILSIAAFALVTAMAALWLQAGNTAARGGSYPPDQPQFEGQFVVESFPAPGLNDRPAQSRTSWMASSWEEIITEDWEDGFDDNVWMTIDRNGSQSGEYKWDVREFDSPPSGGTQSAWAIGGGQDGQNLSPENDGYPGGADSWLIAGPFDLTGAYDAELSFNYWFEADAGDTFSVLVSTDGISWEGKQTDDGGAGQWFGRNYALDVYLGEPAVYIAFHFMSNASGDNNKLGTFVDDIVVRGNFGNKQYLPHVLAQASPTSTLTPTPTTTVPPPPPQAFNDDFTSNIDGWAARRAKNGASYQITHRSDSDGARQGQLQIELNTEDDFVIASPLIPGKLPPYNIEFYAKLKDPQDRHMYGIVFGADWNGGPCTAPSSPSCFNRYYELRVQYRDFNGQRFQELKLKRIDSHDAGGEPVGPTLIDFKKGGNVGPDDWVEIDVNVTDTGQIRISWNDKFIAEAQDDELIMQPYFGLLLITKENDDARVKFDYLRID